MSVYYGIARGTKDATASEMTKWFNTNYHYIVPELDGASPVLTENKPLLAYREAKEKLGIEGKPVIVGPLTFLKLSKGYSAVGNRCLAGTAASALCAASSGACERRRSMGTDRRTDSRNETKRS